MPPGHARTTDRKPQTTPEEMQTCIPFLHEQIDLIRPKVLVALGGTAIEGLLGKRAGSHGCVGMAKLSPAFH